MRREESLVLDTSRSRPWSLVTMTNAAWESSKVPAKHPDYGNKLKQTVIRYNGKRI